MKYCAIILLLLVSCSPKQPPTVLQNKKYSIFTEQCYTACATDRCLCRCKIIVKSLQDKFGDDTWQFQLSGMDSLDQLPLSEEEIEYCN